MLSFKAFIRAYALTNKRLLYLFKNSGSWKFIWWSIFCTKSSCGGDEEVLCSPQVARHGGQDHLQPLGHNLSGRPTRALMQTGKNLKYFINKGNQKVKHTHSHVVRVG